MTKKGKKMLIILSVIVAVVVALIVWTVWSNLSIELNEYTISSSRLPAEFDGYRIVQVSDLHNAEKGKDNADLLRVIEQARPDIIVVTGDALHSKQPKFAITQAFFSNAVKIAPCYYVTGNHEARISKKKRKAFETEITNMGVTVLHDKEVILKKGESSISLVGIDDHNYANSYGGVAKDMSPEKLKALSTTGGFSILLSHQPQFFDAYASAGYDLVLSGHTHGGQIRLPFIGAVLVPDQEIFPKYADGLFTKGDTKMIISRGIGDSGVPFRFNNRPEVVLVKLQSSNN